ncbi:Protein of unknown function [Pyronema omphalodes CBS 100304]|uniref:Uncharacterized protein n=1 Tax=Pyronema omphalodes (strain CBS 100304) TaxID=1076935 RepID=U4KW74_PYROM|nr:Protein of unknown function [Pyronema omphalodes CBS 100304]
MMLHNTQSTNDTNGSCHTYCMKH